MEVSDILRSLKDLDNAIVRCVFANDEEYESLPRLTPTQMQILSYLLEKGAVKITQRELMDVLKVKRATVSGVLQTMEKNGLLRREVDEEDSRVNILVLEDKTIELFEKNKKRFDAIGKNLIKDISEEELENFTKVLNKMIQNLK